MEYVLPVIVALLASLLTFFSGFGLGTLLLPAFAVFFPTEVAITLTAIVHFLNNLFKTGLIGRRANVRVLLLFGLPAGVAAWLGARALSLLADTPPLLQYEVLGEQAEITAINLTIAGLMVVFAITELSSVAKRLQISPRLLPVGGLLSGFFGGLSGHQGALRSMFLIKAGLNKEAFIATGIVISLVIDITRISTYLSSGTDWYEPEYLGILIPTVLAAFIGALLGRRLLTKMTLENIQLMVSALIFLMALLIGSGLL